MADATRFEARVANLDCESDAHRIERALGLLPGIEALTVFPRAARVDVSFDPAQLTEDRVRATLAELGFPPQVGLAMAEATPPWRNPKVLASLSSGALLLAGWLISRSAGESPVAIGLYVASLIVGGYFFAREALEELIHEREVGIELLMTVAAVVATVMGAPGEGAMLAFLYSISEAAEGYTEQKTRSAVRALMDLAPKFALVRRDGPTGATEVEIPVEEVVTGDVFMVKPGQSIATDGEVLLGASSVNQAPVTGESVPVAKGPGDAVFAGTVNGEGALEVRATRAFAENTIARIIHMVEEAQERKGTSERFIERFGRRYSPAVLAIGVLVAILPPLLLGGGWVTWITRATVLVVAAAPCALVISIPITLVAALGTGARRGILIKGGVFVEELARIRTVALDKTGTITHGAPRVTEIVVLPGLAATMGPVDARVVERHLLGAAAGVERFSQHPLAQAVVRVAEERGVVPADATDFQSITGAGARAVVGQHTLYAASPTYGEARLDMTFGEHAATIARLEEDGNTVIVIGTEGTAWGLIAMRDTVRKNARAAIEGLRAQGVRRVVMLTGDNPRTAAAVAREVGLDEVYADLKPEDKAIRIRELTMQDGHVAMVGDGVNDAPALAEATVGVAMGAAGTDVALETADVALMADDLEKLVEAIRLARRNQQIVRQNLALSVVVIALLVVGAVTGRFTLPMAVFGHELSEFVVIASGLRMLRA